MEESAVCEPPPEGNAARPTVPPCRDGSSPRADTDEDAGRDAHEDAGRDPHRELAQLRRAMRTRPTIDQACGVLMATFGLSPRSAWQVLVATSQNTNTKLHSLADELVGNAGGGPLSTDVRHRLAEAVARAKAGTAAPEATP
ncbi:ANTAR domain-containing protein [Streptomyces sp. WMMB 714]|uniref:ANTAR domain-containing protein n=1 Tax=Streptomyces sp. WMMB 714 TaxID=1286822 RepID=UPI0006972ED1|nr:ANTAR domain-containing protein [Streptomyces sp. WMMB 714]SCK46941.1 ANTAR domain-containing protein [Streptomyces sp. WMMB 714]